MTTPATPLHGARAVGRRADRRAHRDRPAKAAHIVKTEPGESAVAKVTEARIYGFPVEALCGERFVPAAGPEEAAAVRDLQGDLRPLPPDGRRRALRDARHPEPLSRPRRRLLALPAALALRPVGGGASAGVVVAAGDGRRRWRHGGGRRRSRGPSTAGGTSIAVAGRRERQRRPRRPAATAVATSDRRDPAWRRPHAVAADGARPLASTAVRPPARRSGWHRRRRRARPPRGRATGTGRTASGRSAVASTRRAGRRPRRPAGGARVPGRSWPRAARATGRDASLVSGCRARRATATSCGGPRRRGGR